MNYQEKSKVFAYIIRKHENQLELLVFKHRDFPEAGIQVPAGTVEPNEDLLDALKREVKEESGLEGFQSIQFLGEQKYIAAYKKEIHHRHFYQLHFTAKYPKQFSHIVTGIGEDTDLVFNYEWIPLSKLPKLIADHDYLIQLLEKSK